VKCTLCAWVYTGCAMKCTLCWSVHWVCSEVYIMCWGVQWGVLKCTLLCRQTRFRSAEQSMISALRRSRTVSGSTGWTRWTSTTTTSRRRQRSSSLTHDFHSCASSDEDDDSPRGSLSLDNPHPSRLPSVYKSKTTLYNAKPTTCFAIHQSTKRGS